MREIKFRGKTKALSEWVVGSLIIDKERTWISVQKEHWNMGTFDNIEVVPESVGQYTGLKDENGREIYDGDIIKVWITKTINFVAMVDCLNGAFGIGSIPSGYGYHHKFSSFHNNVGTRYEVIGNAYENKELLEEK